jgi:hypothetical protein
MLTLSYWTFSFAFSVLVPRSLLYDSQHYYHSFSVHCQHNAARNTRDRMNRHYHSHSRERDVIPRSHSLNCAKSFQSWEHHRVSHVPGCWNLTIQSREGWRRPKMLKLPKQSNSSRFHHDNKSQLEETRRKEPVIRRATANTTTNRGIYD